MLNNMHSFNSPQINTANYKFVTTTFYDFVNYFNMQDREIKYYNATQKKISLNNGLILTIHCYIDFLNLQERKKKYYHELIEHLDNVTIIKGKHGSK